MKPRLFQDGQKVKHLGAHVGKPNRAVTIIECINADEPSDVVGATMTCKLGKDPVEFWNPGQGYRYLVSYKGQVWSVPEAFLRAR